MRRFQDNGLKRQPMLPWPRDLFSRFPSSSKMDGVKDEAKCACNCGAPHRNAVSRVVNETEGYGTPVRRVLWYCNMAHKVAHLAKEKAHA